MSLVFDLVFHAEALALDGDGLGVVQEAVEDGGGEVLTASMALANRTE